MHPIKMKRLSRLAAQLRPHYPIVAAELDLLVAGASNKPHPNPVHIVATGGLSEVLQRVVVGLQGRQVPFALAGGLAVISWVDLRKSLDIDFAVVGEALPAVQQMFPGGADLPIMYTTNLAGVDVDFLKPLGAWTEQAIATAVVRTVLGVQVPVVLPEYLILYKFLAARERDVEDIVGLLSLPKVPGRARDLIIQYMPEEIEDFDQLVAEAEFGV
jgi:hypothetical protein